METALKVDVAILRTWKVDEVGNCQFRYSTKTFGPLIAKAARIAIVEAENIVPVGSIHPDQVHLPGIYIDRIVPSTTEKKVEVRKIHQADDGKGDKMKQTDAIVRRNRIAKRASKELKHGYYVNLGVGEFIFFRLRAFVLHSSMKRLSLNRIFLRNTYPRYIFYTTG